MKSINMLEQLANSVHHQIDLASLLQDQPEKIREAVQNNNSDILKTELADAAQQPDRSTIFKA